MPSKPIAISGVELSAKLNLAIGECPLWSAYEQCLYFVDIAGKQIFCFNPVDASIKSWIAPAEPGCIALMPGRRLMVALRHGFASLDCQSGQWGEVLRVDHDSKLFRFNDGRTDPAGRFWAGSMYDPRDANLAALYCLDHGKLKRVLGPENNQGVKVSNGLAFDLEQGYMYQSDTPDHVIYRYAYTEATGMLGQRQIFVKVNNDKSAANYAGRPDGAAIDSLGGYWSAQYEGARILRFDRQGIITHEIKMPVRRPTMIAFGGKHLKTLFITSAAQNASSEELASYPDSGSLFSVNVPIAGLAEPFYQE